MKKYMMLLFLVSALVPASAQNQKLAQAGFKFLSVATDPRVVAMGEAETAVEGGSTSLFFNPAGMARMENGVQAVFGNTQWIADIKHYYGSVAIASPNDGYGVLGFTYQSVKYGDLLRTVLADNADGYVDAGTFSPVAVSLGMGYARALSDRFSIGARVAYNIQDLGDGFTQVDKNNNPIAAGNKLEVLSFDFGMFYKTGFRSLNFAASIKNFSKEITYQREGFQLPLTFRIGLSMNVTELVSSGSEANPFLIAVDAINARDFPETINIGGEYVFMKTLALRGGYMFGYDEQSYTVGLGLKHSFDGVGIGLDYAYTPFGVFGSVSRFAIQMFF
jgi:hypothetical protein